MSQEVDERVVEMRFDNAQFEKNVHQTMQSLEKLNDSLRLDGAEKGFEKIGDASAKVDFDEMQGALDNLSGKFSAVEVMGVAALSHITRQAVDTGEKLVKSLSLDQVTSGWNKYAQKTASVQTIMNATGKSIAKVNGYLSKLMWFSDETSYSFTDMTQSLRQLTASGGDIEKVIPMIMGMANATAYAGKGASEFSRVIYNLNQSYSQGYLSLMDWKSVELAGVATAELKKQIIETGVALGKIKEGAVTVGTFGSTLSKKWADKEVMETAFGKFAEFSEAVKKMVDANPGMLASQAIDALADKYDEVTVKAFKAAQEAKSFSEAVDATKDAVSSGWMETFDILFGNYEEAKGFWSDLAEEFWNMFAGGAAGRNNWLKNAFDSGLDQLLGTEGFGEAGDNYTNLLQKALVNQGLLSEEGIEEAGSFQKALEESGVTAQQLYEVLGEAADYYHQRAAMSDKELDKLGLDRDKVDALANAYDSMAEQIQNGSVNLDDLAGKMNQLSGREHFFNGILNVLEGINSVLSPIRDGFGDVFMTDGSPLYNFLKGFDELTGKMALSEETAEKVQKVFTGVFRVLSIGLKGVKAVGKTAFMILGKLLDLLSPMGDLLLNIGSCIGNLLTWVDESLGQAESLSDVLGILVGAVAALLSPIADVVKGVKALVRGGSMEEAKKQFGAFGTVVDAVGSVLDKFKIGSVSAGNVIGTAFQLLGGILLGAFEGMGALIGRAFNGFKGAGDTVSEFADSKVPLLENIRDVVLSLPEKAEKALADFGGTLTGIMIEMAMAIKMLADVDFTDIVKSVFSLAAALGVLIAGCWGLGFVSANLASAAGACLMLATALLILTPAFKGLASLTAGEAFAGVIGTIGIMLGLFAVGAITPVAAGMVVFSACLISLGKAFSAFAGGIIKLSIAAAILTVLSAFAGPLREVIVNAADDIEAALTAILTAICNTINNCAEPIGAALLTLFKVLIQTVIDLIGWAWSGEGGEGNGIEGALEELWSQFVEWLGEKKDEAGELIGKQLNPANWFTVKGGLLGSLLDSADTAADEREMTEYGTYMAEGLANGLTGPESTNAVTGGIATLCSTVETFFRNFWGINSPSVRMATLSEYIPEGFKEGLTGTDGTAAIGDGISGMLDSAGSWLDKLFPGLLNKAKNYGSQFQNALLSGSEYQGMPGFDEWYEKEISAYRAKQPGGKTGLTAEDLDADIKKDPKDAKNQTGRGGKTKKSSGSGTKKTVAQQIEEKYKPKLEANKAAREALDSEYELWQVENQYSADEDTLLAKKMENAAAEIANQTDRVAIAQAKYDEMLKRWGADKTETKEAYASLLSEKTSLAKLQADQYTGLFEDITKRYDTDLGTLEKEYNLWTTQNSNTASKLDKIDRETEYQKDELELKQKKEAKAKEQWETLRKEYGESDLRTKEAWNDYLDAQTESLQLQNDIAKQSLNKLDAQLSIIKDEQSRMQSRMDLLTSIYGDGSLKDREDAYKQAVEQYGENSAEARKAKYQGITTSILGTVEALQNMNTELEKTRLIQQQLADGKDLNGNPLSKDDVNDLKDQLLSSRSSMVSFAGALADAMGLEDSAKSAVVKLANAIQKNWVPISNACSEVWTKVSGAMGEEMTNTLSTVFKAAFSEEGMEIGTEFVSAIASAMQGDYAGAIISAATGLIDLLFTDTGKQLTGGAGDMLLKLFSGIQNGDLAGKLANIGTAAANVGNSLSGLLPMLGQLGTTGAGAGMAVGGIGEALGGLGASILAVLPELLIVVGIIAAIAALIGGIAWFISSRKKEKATGAKDVGSEIDKGISDGVKEDAPIVDDAVSDMTENAMDIAKGTLGTISKVMGDDYEYTPQIVPVVDLTNVLEGADEIDNAFAATKSLSLDGDVSRNLANKIDAEVQLQNGLKSAGNEDTLRAINALAGHMDGVAESIKGMSVTINGRKAIGYIDDRMGRLTAAKVK